MINSDLILSIILFIISGLLFLAFFMGIRERRLKIEYLENNLPSFKNRMDIEVLTKKYKKMRYSAVKKEIDDHLLKFKQIDDLGKFKSSIKDFEKVVSQLNKMDLPLFQENYKVINRLISLADKYNSEIADRILRYDYFLGMTIEQLLDCRGEPDNIETEVLKTKTKEIYVYGNKSSGDVFTFVNGELERFKDRGNLV